MGERITAVIVDDERLARRELRRMLAAHPGVEILAEAGSVRQAVDAIETHHPDVAFLDVVLEDGSAFDVLDRSPHCQTVVFITAHPGFESRAGAVKRSHFMTKPITSGDLTRVVRVIASERKE